MGQICDFVRSDGLTKFIAQERLGLCLDLARGLAGRHVPLAEAAAPAKLHPQGTHG